MKIFFCFWGNKTIISCRQKWNLRKKAKYFNAKCSFGVEMLIRSWWLLESETFWIFMSRLLTICKLPLFEYGIVCWLKSLSAFNIIQNGKFRFNLIVSWILFIELFDNSKRKTMIDWISLLSILSIIIV